MIWSTKIASFFKDVFYSLIKFLMIRHHRWCIPSTLLSLLQVTLHLSIRLNLTPVACLATPYRLPIIYFIATWGRFKCGPVHFGIGIGIVCVTISGILWNIVDSIGFGDLKWVICFLSFACIRIYILASSNWPDIRWFAFGLIIGNVDIVTIERTSLGILRPITLLNVIFIELWVELCRLVHRRSHWLGLNMKRRSNWLRLNIFGSLNRHLQILLRLSPFFLVVNDKAKDIF